MSPLQSLIAARIRQKRRELGVTQHELARILGCTFQLVQHYENGTCQMPISMLYDFSLLCRVPLDWFFVEAKEVLGCMSDSL